MRSVYIKFSAESYLRCSYLLNIQDETSCEDFVRPRDLSRDYDVPINIVDKPSQEVSRKSKTGLAERSAQYNNGDYDVPTLRAEPQSRAANTALMSAVVHSNRRELPRPPRSQISPDSEHTTQPRINLQDGQTCSRSAIGAEKRLENRDSVIDDYDIPRHRTMTQNATTAHMQTRQQQLLGDTVSSGRFQETQRELLNAVEKIKEHVIR